MYPRFGERGAGARPRPCACGGVIGEGMYGACGMGASGGMGPNPSRGGEGICPMGGVGGEGKYVAGGIGDQAYAGC